ncbi:MAG: ribulose 1,5-bisphosphate carboxylase [Candidatus Thorarchaeota archaeon]|nr:MAG: ribulose 1,5-bisphosphate carboxylase [Candidatus Thorarchaeota archaeon]
MSMERTPLEALPDALPDGIDIEKYVIGTYYVGIPPMFDARDLAWAAAVEQSTGTWIPVPGETVEVRKRHIAKVIGIYEVPYHEYSLPKDLERREYIIQVAFPHENFGPQIPMLLSTVVGNISMGGRIKCLDLRFPKSWLKSFKGPKFGIKGLRKLTGVKDRPLLNNMIKPCVYPSAKMGAGLFYEAAAGGADIIKDDELLANPRFNSLAERVPLFMEAADRADAEKGEKTLYTANITDSVPQIFENAEKAQEWGANALMVNFLAVGYSVFQHICEDPSVKVPVLAHMDIAGALYESPITGMSSNLVIGKLPRICGSDITVFPAPYGKAPILKERYLGMAHEMVMPLLHIDQTAPMPSGGISQGMVEEVMNDLGPDIVIGSGGAIHAHPKGPRAGATAFRQAIDAKMKGIPVSQYATDHEELRVAMETYGSGKTGFEL